jgi:hypothetical protein
MLRQMDAQCIDQLGSLPHQKVARAKDHGSPCCSSVLNATKRIVGLEAALGDRLGVGSVVLLPAHKWLDVNRWNEPHVVPETADGPSPIVRRCACFHRHDGRRLLAQKAEQLRPRHLLRNTCRPSPLRLNWRENPSFVNSAPTVSALIGCPISVSAAASFAMLFDTRIKGRMGSPNVAGSTSRLSAGTSPGSAPDTDRRPPPARRTCPFASGSPSRSSSPRLIVERASPVIFETSARPPRPASAPRLHRRKQPPTTLVKPRADRLAAESPPRRSCDRTTPLRRIPESPTP